MLKELPGGKDPLSGNRLKLTLSAELQAFAEQLLIQNEDVRQGYASVSDVPGGLLTKQPWMKGGAIIAMDPQNGEILAMASYPRFDPNDFIVSGNPEISSQKRNNIQRWLEQEEYIAQVWDGQRSFANTGRDPYYRAPPRFARMTQTRLSVNVVFSIKAGSRVERRIL